MSVYTTQCLMRYGWLYNFISFNVRCVIIHNSIFIKNVKNLFLITVIVKSWILFSLIKNNLLEFSSIIDQINLSCYYKIKKIELTFFYQISFYQISYQTSDKIYYII